MTQDVTASSGVTVPADHDGPVSQDNALGTTFDVLQIMAAIPHRYPFLMIDRMIDVVKGQSAVGIKNVTINEPFFQGHFPSKPVMPGVLIIEAMAQTAAALVVLTLGDRFEGKLVYFMTIENAKFRRPVVPGDQLRIHVDKERQRGNVYKFRGVARVDGVSVAEAHFGAIIME
ncbi:3-hydroxyacyl-ACP dehydratase FabZ [Lichenicola cladoniae]|uniref:3-hydroxyacyl-[acyl-carrier-protein] dehydratase FabZ n=1 Tax=Lichenicola cladoniae TaxID=1484109 RepID=A0A6M8HPI4_9PROT|nr:3-hydroxyacyl-ACP dehydratase FabZ [Lichenicola cladoniae]NPD66456.1 3-hydroxyacyl-ACP dehydratase FabZ [Acetobacteraceae bacterium]QKE90314.1 3-hydroxyacyl-ACP dehydratase FabZ [Lichenicola cladoniae]